MDYMVFFLCLISPMLGIEDVLARNIDYQALKNKARDSLFKFLKPYPKAMKAWEFIHGHEYIKANWDLADYLLLEKMHFNDHGRGHAYVAAMNAVNLMLHLMKVKVKPDFVKDHGGDLDDAMTILVVATLLHDIGNQVSRENHHMYGVMLTSQLVEEILKGVNPKITPEKITIMKGFILHCIASHDLDTQPLTTEAAVCSIGDGMDMTRGRSFTARKLGSFSMHALSVWMIESVTLSVMNKKVQIRVVMDDLAGVFQIEQLLLPKVKSTYLMKYIDLLIDIIPRKKKKSYYIRHKAGDYHFE